MAAIEKIIQGLALPEVTCPICLDLLHVPVLTPCGHDFCQMCMDRMIDEHDGNDVQNCPICRAEFSEYSLNPRLKKQLDELYPEESTMRKRMREERQDAIPPRQRRRTMRLSANTNDVIFVMSTSNGFRQDNIGSLQETQTSAQRDHDFWSSFFTLIEDDVDNETPEMEQGLGGDADHDGAHEGDDRDDGGNEGNEGNERNDGDDESNDGDDEYDEE